MFCGEGEYGADMEGPDKACSMLGRQMMLPLRGAKIAHSVRHSLGRCVRGQRWPRKRKLKGRPAAICPLQGASCASVRERWRSLHERHAELYKLDAATTDLKQEFLHGRNGTRACDKEWR